MHPVIIFFYALYFIVMEGIQLRKLGMAAYFGSFWNFLDLASYTAALVITPSVVLRFGLQNGGFVYALVGVVPCLGLLFLAALTSATCT